MNEQQIRDALRGVAEAPGRPDEAAAWARISDGIAQGDATAARRRWLLGGAGLAVVGAAAALVLVLGTGEDQDAVEVGPAAPSTTTSTTAGAVAGTTATTQPVDPSAPPVEVLGDLPEHPLAVVVEDEALGAQRLDLYDADTGELVVRNLDVSYHSLSEVSVRPDGTIFYTEEFGDSSTVRSIRWDGSGGPVTPFGITEDEGTNGGAMSPDGATFAFVEHGVTREVARIGLVDVDTLAVRYLEYADDAPSLDTLGGIHDVEFSPDGSRLVFTRSYESSEILLLDLDAEHLDDATYVGSGFAPAWLDATHLVYVHDCCQPDFLDPHDVRSFEVGGGEPVPYAPVDTDLAEALSGDWGAHLAYVGDGSVVVVVDGEARAVPVGERAVDVGM